MHNEKMLRLQAKHFGLDAQIKLNQITTDALHQRSLLQDNQRRSELAEVFKGSRHSTDVKNMIDKLHKAEHEIRQTKGLKTMSPYRHLSI